MIYAKDEKGVWHKAYVWGGDWCESSCDSVYPYQDLSLDKPEQVCHLCERGLRRERVATLQSKARLANTKRASRKG